MQAQIAQVGEFDTKLESWEQYAEKLGHFLDANGIEDATKKRSVFLSVIGPTTYKVLASLIAPEKPGDKDYEELVKVLKEHHNCTLSDIVQRYKFHTRTRQPSESTTQFVAELRALAQYCNFGASLTDLLRDRIVCGINDDHIQRILLSEKALTFEKALELAVSLETARKNVSELQGTAMLQAVHRIANHACYHCGRGGHQPDKCRFKQVKCLLW